jgi:hypothetical protein
LATVSSSSDSDEDDEDERHPPLSHLPQSVTHPSSSEEDEADEEENREKAFGALQNSCVHLQSTSAGVDSHELLGLHDQSARAYSYDDSAEGSFPHLQKLRRDDDLFVGAEYEDVEEEEKEVEEEEEEEEEEARKRALIARACATPGELGHLAGGVYEEEEEEGEPPPPYEAPVCMPLSFFLEEHGLGQYLEIMR